MKVRNIVKRLYFVAVMGACVGILLPQLALAASPRNAESKSNAPKISLSKQNISDVSLHNQGILVGQVVNQNGKPQASVNVMIGQQGKTIASVKTDSNGKFSVSDLSGGVYQVATSQGGGVYRLWAPQTAPPVAQNGVLIVAGDEVVRGQFGGGGWGFLANPWVIGGIIATAIALPIALDNNNGS